MSQRRPRSWQEMREQEINWLIERTGEGLEAWKRRVAQSGAQDETSLRKWLGEKGVTGYPAMLLVMERFGYPDYLQKSAEDLLETAKNFPQSSATHKIGLASVDDLDDEVVGWIKRSYAENI